MEWEKLPQKFKSHWKRTLSKKIQPGVAGNRVLIVHFETDIFRFQKVFNIKKFIYKNECTICGLNTEFEYPEETRPKSRRIDWHSVSHNFSSFVKVLTVICQKIYLHFNLMLIQLAPFLARIELLQKVLKNMSPCQILCKG